MYGIDNDKGLNFARLAIARAVGGMEAADYAAARWGARSTVVRLTKAAVGAGATGTWGDELVGEYSAAAAEFIGLVRQQSIAGRLSGLRRVPPRIPILTQTAGAVGAWVKPGHPMPVRGNVYDRGTLDTLKVTAATVLTEELAKSADPAAEGVIRDDLVRAVTQASDLAFIDPANAGVADEKPASITHGLTAHIATGVFKNDLDQLAAEFEGDLSVAYLVGRPELFVQISGAAFPNVGARGGELAGIPALASTGIPNDGDGSYQLALIDPSGVTFASDDDRAEVKSTTQATIEMNDAPTNNGVTPTATNMVSLFQVNGLALAALLRENWQVSRAGSVSLLAGIAPSWAPAS